MAGAGTIAIDGSEVAVALERAADRAGPDRRSLLRLVGRWELDLPLGLGGADAAHEGELVDRVAQGRCR